MIDGSTAVTAATLTVAVVLIVANLRQARRANAFFNENDRLLRICDELVEHAKYEEAQRVLDHLNVRLKWWRAETWEYHNYVRCMFLGPRSPEPMFKPPRKGHTE